jgi:hypothetical protein
MCDLAVRRRKRLVIVLDEINALDDEARARALLADITTLAERYATAGVGFVLSSRPEYWNKLSRELRHRLWQTTFTVGPYTDAECLEGLHKRGVSVTDDELRKHPARELLHVPIFQRLLSELDHAEIGPATVTALFDRWFDEKIDWSPDRYRVVRRLCGAMAASASVGVADFRDELHGRDDDDAFRLLLADELLVEQKASGRTTFAFDTFGEYAFSRVIFDARLSEFPKDVTAFVTWLTAEWRAIAPFRLAYRIFWLEAMRFFIIRRNDDDIATLLASSDSGVVQLTKDAIYLRRGLRFEHRYAGDPFLVSIALLRRTNDPAILSALIVDDVRTATRFSLNIAGKLFPGSLLSFLIFVARTVREDSGDRRERIRVLLNGLLIYFMRNDPDEDNVSVQIGEILETVLSLERPLVIATLDELLLQNSRYLLYSDSASRIADISELEAVHRDRLIVAIRGSIFDLDDAAIHQLIDRGMVPWMAVMYVSLRDRTDARLGPTLERIFQRNDARSQDFVLTLYGHLAKFDSAKVEILLDYTLRMQRDFPSNFYNVGADPDSQYDPLVPYVSTKLISSNADRIELPPTASTDAYVDRLARLFYKLAVDFPEQTLRTIYDLRGSVEVYTRFGPTLKTIQMFHPQVFWRLTKEHNIDDCFRETFDDTSWEPKAVRQVRDWDWYRIFAAILKAPATAATVDEVLVAALRAESFQTFLSSLFDGAAPSA